MVTKNLPQTRESNRVDMRALGKQIVSEHKPAFDRLAAVEREESEGERSHTLAAD